MASIKDIANKCGVSVATVSKALNDKDDISEKTKQRIKQTAKEMQYFPQYYARAIRMNKSYNLGILFVDEAMSGLTHDYFANILNSFKVTAEDKEYDITFINSSKKYKKSKTYLEHVRYRGLDGVVIACIDFHNPEVIELVNSDIPLVTIDKEFPGKLSVNSDNYAGMQRLVKYCISMGHSKIAYISGDISDVTNLRVESFKKTMKAAGIDVRPEYQLSSEYRNPKKARECTEILMKLEDPPTCILYPDDYSAVGGFEVLRAMGLSVPDDISIAGYDDIFIAGQLIPRLTTIHQDTEAIGRIAAEKLIGLIERKKKKNTIEKPVVVASTLVKGASVRNLNA